MILRYQSCTVMFCFLVQAIHSVAWHHEGKQFICSHSDGTLTIWNVKSPTKPFQTITPHGKIENRCSLCALKPRGNLMETFNGNMFYKTKY